MAPVFLLVALMLFVHIRSGSVLFLDLSGQIPGEIGELTDLWYLDLYWNSFTGDVPEELNDLTNLQKIYIYDNLFSGDVGTILCSVSLEEFIADCSLYCACCTSCHDHDGDCGCEY